MGRGSWPPLLVAAALFLGAFAWQRHRSSFLRIEAMAATLAPDAQAAGLPLADGLALRAMVGVDAATAWGDALKTFAADRARLGDGLAAVAMFGERALAEAAVRDAPDPAQAWQRFRTRREAEPGLRFLLLRERFAARRGAAQ